jgi:hypothetical protein
VCYAGEPDWLGWIFAAPAIILVVAAAAALSGAALGIVMSPFVIVFVMIQEKWQTMGIRSKIFVVIAATIPLAVLVGVSNYSVMLPDDEYLARRQGLKLSSDIR